MSILQMSVSAGLLVIVIVLIRAVALNRLPKKMFLVLWGVVLIRLLVPVSISLPFSIPNIIDEISKAMLSDTVQPVIENSINTGEMVIGRAEIPGTVKQFAEVEQEHIFNIAPTTVIWIVGMLAAFIFFAFIYFRNHRNLRYAMAIRDNDFLNEWLSEHELLRSITILQSDRIISPLAVGIFKPRIILPKSMNMSDEQLLNYVLTHEYFHIKRYDALWKMLLLFALCTHWFNPMVWVMFVLASRDLELTCDESVIYQFGAKTKKAYAYMLIGMAEKPGKFAPLYNGFSRNATEERIESIMKIKKTSLFAMILAFVLVSALTVGMLAASAANNSEPSAIINGSDEKEEITYPTQFLQDEQLDANTDAGNDTGINNSIPLETDTQNTYIWPLENNQTITSIFETKINPITGETKSHDGIDIKANLDTPVMTANSGTVKEADYNGENGLYVIIDHGSGVGTLYACLSKQTVKEGDEVKQGDIIGNVGSTGASTGPHLHFGILINDEFVDPLVYFHNGNTEAVSSEQRESEQGKLKENNGMLSDIPPEIPEITSSSTSDIAEIESLPTREDILKIYPEIDTSILDVVFSKQPNGAVWRLLSVRHDDERKFSKDDWQAILKAIDFGFVSWED